MLLCVALPMHMNLDLQHSCYSSPGPLLCQTLFVYSYSNVYIEAVLVNSFYSFSTFAFHSDGIIHLVHGSCYEGQGPDMGLAGTEVIP